MPIPRRGHEDVGADQQQDGEEDQGAFHGRHYNILATPLKRGVHQVETPVTALWFGHGDAQSRQMDGQSGAVLYLDSDYWRDV